MTGNEDKVFLQEMYNAVCDPDAESEVSKRFFTDDFVHVVDGAVFDCLEFDAQLATLWADLKTIAFDFNTVVAEGNCVADVHFSPCYITGWSENDNQVHRGLYLAKWEDS